MAKKLDAALTKSVFSATTKEDLAGLLTPENIESVSRMAIDESLNKIFKVKVPTYDRAKAGEVLLDFIAGKTPDIQQNPAYLASEGEVAAADLNLTPEERMEKIRTLLNDTMARNKDFYMFLSKMLKINGFSRLRATAEDIQAACTGNEAVAFCLESSKPSKRPYVIKRTAENMANAEKWGNTVVTK